MREMKDIRNERGSYVDVDVDSRSTGGGLIGRGTITGERKPSQTPTMVRYYLARKKARRSFSTKIAELVGASLTTSLTHG